MTKQLIVFAFIVTAFSNPTLVQAQQSRTADRVSESTMADETLDGKIFCRTVETGGYFGQPKGTSEHCLKFENNFLTDNANTFFGNPPSTIRYEIIHSKIINKTTNEDTGYVIEGDHLLKGEDKIVLIQK